MVWEGLNVVKTRRMMFGEANPADSKPGTRKTFAFKLVGTSFTAVTAYKVLRKKSAYGLSLKN